MTLDDANSRSERPSFNAIDLHFPDLCHEGGSRWMDAGVQLPTIQAVTCTGCSRSAAATRSIGGAPGVASVVEATLNVARPAE
jgi:hypothetical protein